MALAFVPKGQAVCQKDSGLVDKTHTAQQATLPDDFAQSCAGFASRSQQETFWEVAAAHFHHGTGEGKIVHFAIGASCTRLE